MEDHRLPSWIRFDPPAAEEGAGSGRARVRQGTPGPGRTSRKRTNKQRRHRTEATSKAFVNQKPHLLKLLEEAKWREALLRCQSHPSEAEPVRVALPDAPDSDGGVSQANTTETFRRRKRSSCTGAPNELYGNGCYPAPIFRETALGIISASDLRQPAIASATLIELLRCLLDLFPLQVRCSQGAAGHTPLRAALLNPTCPLEIVEIFIEADESIVEDEDEEEGDCVEQVYKCASGKLLKRNVPKQLPAVCQVDRNGLYPVDHLVKAVQLGPEVGGCGCTSQFFRLLTKLLGLSPSSLPSDAQPKRVTRLKNFGECICSSPLARLFSMGTSFGLLPAARTCTSPTGDSIVETPRLHRILLTARHLFAADPKLLLRCSASSGCTPVHVALRNYGNYSRLIHELCDLDVDGVSFRHRNRFGDLPLHVAASVGVPLDVLRLILERTIITSRRREAVKAYPTVNAHESPPATKWIIPGARNSLVWSTNKSGYTAVDLEWIRHIEAGSGFFARRSFYPLETMGIQRPTGRDAELYDVLLTQAVEQVLNRNRTDAGSQISTISSKDAREAKDSNDSSGPCQSRGHAVAFGEKGQATKLNGSFGLLLDRIFLVIRASFLDTSVLLHGDLSDKILHLAAALSGPLGPSLPPPILQLIRCEYKEQLSEADSLGRVPLHYCFGADRFSGSASTLSRPCVPEETTEHQAAKLANQWNTWVRHVVSANPEACRSADCFGRLPLHYALDSSYGEVAHNNAMSLLFETFPESVDARDPVSQSYPFALAASNPSMSLETVYSILKRSPGALAESLGRAQNDKA